MVYNVAAAYAVQVVLSQADAWYAEALHKAGRMEKAEDVFIEAEATHKELDPENPLLYAVISGFLYCDLLLDCS